MRAAAAAGAAYLGDYEKAWRVELDAGNMLWLTRASGYRLVLLPTAKGYLIGSANELSGFGMTVNFVTGDDGKLRLTITTGDGQVIDSLAQV